MLVVIRCRDSISTENCIKSQARRVRFVDWHKNEVYVDIADGDFQRACEQLRADLRSFRESMLSLLNCFRRRKTRVIV